MSDINFKVNLIIPFCLLTINLCSAQDSSGLLPASKDSSVKTNTFAKFLFGAAEVHLISVSRLDFLEFGRSFYSDVPPQEEELSKVSFYPKTFKKSLSLMLTDQYKERFKYDLGTVGQWLGLAKTCFAIILAILSL